MIAHRTTTARGETAFTMIEMIVTMVLLGLAMMVVYPALANILGGSARGAASSQAGGEAVIAARMLEEDVRRAVGNRSTGDRSDGNQLPGTTGIRVSTITALTAGASDPQYPDILVAGRFDLVLNSDVLNAPGIERVTWRRVVNSPTCGDVGAGGRNWCMERTVRSAAGAVLTSEVVVKHRGTFPAIVSSCAPGITGSRVFCYQEAYPGTGGATAYVWNGGWSPRCTVAWRTDGPNAPTGANLTTTTRIATRHNAVDTVQRPSSIGRIDRIMTVGAVMFAGGGYANAGERNYENVTVGIRSRENEAYREAIMCGLRAGWGR